eukprot:TRINITY_DN11482_c0_g1_i2.p1 TRINITY_DN11482_c0_g1~~TRINITY_DN11482_c0_g1_i2.p1  ORF type:complete len:527 (+),score=61.82 TRINITY_DN11482_c0_g1_i2:37-1617(+)
MQLKLEEYSYSLVTCYVFAFACILVPFWGIQTYGTIMLGTCGDCTFYCSSTSRFCHVSKDVSGEPMMCSWTGTRGTYCAAYDGAGCPNSKAGYVANITVGSTVTAPSFSACNRDRNIGSLVFGVVYLTAALCCLTGRFISLKGNFVPIVWLSLPLFTTVCYMSTTFTPTMLLCLLLPCAVMVGCSLPVIWKLHADATSHQCDSWKSIWFSSIILMYSFSQVCGNLLGFTPSVTLVIAACAPLWLLVDSCAGVCDVEHATTRCEGEAPAEECLELVWDAPRNTSNRPLMIIPYMLYFGIEQGFTYSDFTYRWMRLLPATLEEINWVMGVSYALFVAVVSGIVPLSNIILPGYLKDLFFTIYPWVVIVQHTFVVHKLYTGSWDPKVTASFLAIGDALLGMYIIARLHRMHDSAKWVNTFKTVQCLAMSFMFLTNYDTRIFSNEGRLVIMACGIAMLLAVHTAETIFFLNTKYFPSISVRTFVIGIFVLTVLVSPFYNVIYKFSYNIAYYTYVGFSLAVTFCRFLLGIA